MKEPSLKLKHKHFEIVISYQKSQIEKRQSRYRQTLAKRGGKSTTYSLNLNDKKEDLTELYFFENSTYQFYIDFNDNVENAKVTHKLNYINDRFSFWEKSNVLFGVLETKNDIGNFTLPFEYQLLGKTYQNSISFDVLPTKIDYHQDLPQIYQTLDQYFPLWRFSFSAKTTQSMEKSKERGYFPLLWLAHFQQLQQEFSQALKVIYNSPHSRLKSHTLYQKADRVKGRVSEKLVQKIKNDVESKRFDRKYAINQKKLSTDTPENRFIKMVVIQTEKRLANISKTLKAQALDRNEKQKFSDAFYEMLESWQKPLKQFKRLPMFSEIGDFHGLQKASLVLQQKSGYRKVYAIWQELKYYLDALANKTEVSVKSIAELYEVWCFLMVRNVLVENLGFKETKQPKQNFQINALEKKLKDDEIGSFEFERGYGENKIALKLAHEKRFTKKSNPHSYLVPQKPDIYLEVKYPNGKQAVWLFDAKYRVDNRDENIDFVPDDALNQMHRYRDALIYLENNEQKHRPVLGAFALYPGFFDQEKSENPYQTAINEMGIGAFALLPSADNSGAIWLTKYLESQFKENSIQSQKEHLALQEPARISYSGMKQTFYDNLVMFASLGNEVSEQGDKRSESYFKCFKMGTAKYYHMPKSVFDDKFQQYGKHIINEIRFLALAEKNDNGDKFIDKVWQVEKVEKVEIKERRAITEEQAGYKSDSLEKYYLFTLVKPLKTLNQITFDNSDSFTYSMKLTTLDRISTYHKFEDVEMVYTL